MCKAQSLYLEALLCSSKVPYKYRCKNSVCLCSFFCCLCWFERHHIALLATYLRHDKRSVDVLCMTKWKNHFRPFQKVQTTLEARTPPDSQPCAPVTLPFNLNPRQGLFRRSVRYIPRFVRAIHAQRPRFRGSGLVVHQPQKQGFKDGNESAGNLEKEWRAQETLSDVRLDLASLRSLADLRYRQRRSIHAELASVRCLFVSQQTAPRRRDPKASQHHRAASSRTKSLYNFSAWNVRVVDRRHDRQPVEAQL